MPRMIAHRPAILIILLVLGFAPGSPSQQVRRGTMQYQRYEDRIAALEAELKTAGPGERKDILPELCNSCLARARFFKTLWESAAAVQCVYYEQLEKNNLSRDLFALYRGMTLFELGRHEEAATCLSAAASSRKISPQQAQLARAWLAAAQFRAGRQEKANTLWPLLPQKDRRLVSEVAFLKTRVHARSDEAGEFPGGTAPAQQSQGVIKNTAFILASRGEVRSMREYLDKLDPGDPAFIENKGSISEARYYDPSVLFVMYRGCLQLCMDYARQLGAVTDPADEKRKTAAVSQGICSYETEEFGKVIEVLHDCSDPIGRVYLAATLARRGGRPQADSLIGTILGCDSPEVLSEFGRVFLDVPGYDVQRYSIDVCKRALALAKTRSGAARRPPQPFYRNLGLGLMRKGQTDEALATFNEGYRMDLKDNLQANDPEYIIRFSASIVAASHLRTISDANRMLLPVVEMYHAAVQLTDPIRKIDVLTVGKGQGGATLSQ